MPLTLRQLNRATLARQMLLEREAVPVADAVRRIAAVQAQEPASPYLALWNRVAGFDPADLDAAFREHSVVKASLLRITLHAVHADDYTTFHEAMLKNLRASRLNDRRFTSTGLTAADADALVPHLVELTSGRAMTQAEIEAMLTERLGADAEPRLWWALRTFAPLVHAPRGGPWSFGPRASFVAGPTSPARTGPDDSLQRLLRRYLEAFGPATAADFGQFALQRQPPVRAALEALRETLVTLEGPGGAQLFDVPGAPLPDEDTPAPPRLMAMWDSVLLAHADRDRVIPREHRGVAIRRNGDVLPSLLVDGHVCGVWRPVDGGIEAHAFRPLPEEAWEGLAGEAAALVRLLSDRQPTVYSRYARWWPSLPPGEVRVLPG